MGGGSVRAALAFVGAAVDLILRAFVTRRAIQ